MSSIVSPQPSNGLLARHWIRWIPIAISLFALYVPTFVDLGRSLWTQDDHMHGPIVLAVVLWIVWQQRSELLAADTPRFWTGIAGLTFGLALYVLGRSQDIVIFEVGSLIVVLGGVLLAMQGWQTVWRFKFPLLFILFMLPLPGVLVDALTGPLKQQVSGIAENMLYALGYPIGRTGVILTVGPYQLLVADACSGLHSLISMSAMGLLYIYLMDHRNLWRNLVLAACLLPIAFAANVVRVSVLVLVTYHFGDEAGQGFIHGFSGIFLFVVGLLILFVIDAALGHFRTFARTEPRLT
ncbi:MAG: exosortase B [Betaproteobacteria bacterium]|nr:exosortase B [Betaproteobacteria bacterium]